MSHIHIPDGVLPLWLWGPGWLAALALVAIAGRLGQRSQARRKVALLGVVASLMLVAMSSEIVPIAYHVNLTVLGGILLGPTLSVIAAFVAEVILAMLGHGGVTVLGLNTLIIAAEMVLGWALFSALLKVLSKRRAGVAAGTATVITLATTTSLLVLIVWAAGSTAATERETGALDPASLRFENPFAGGLFEVGLFSGGEGHEEEVPEGAEEGAEVHEEEEEHDGDEEGHAALSVRRFALVVYTLGPIGWLIEALVTAGVVSYIAKVRPSLVFKGALSDTGRVLPGDQSGGM